MRVTLKGDWKKLEKLTPNLAIRYRLAAKQAVLMEAELIAAKMVRGLLSGAPAGKAFKAHSPATGLIRRATGFGGSKILVRSGTLLGSIGIKKFAGGVFVGVRRGGRGSTGRGKMSMVNLAKLHEEGRSWIPTARQLRWLMAHLRSGRGKAPDRPRTSTPGGRITIPARPFVTPVVEEAKADVHDNVVRRLKLLMGGDVG